MALKTYKWNGATWQIDDKDLHRYPGAVLVEPEKKQEEKPEEQKEEKPEEQKEEKQKEKPANKSGKAPKTK